MEKYLIRKKRKISKEKTNTTEWIQEIQNRAFTTSHQTSIQSFTTQVKIEYTSLQKTSIRKSEDLPLGYQDAWNDKNVKLPCSPYNTYKKQNKILSKWYLIKSVLSDNINSSIDLEEAILTMNPGWSGKWNFDSLHALFTTYLTVDETKKFFNETLPQMQKLALRLPNLCLKPIPLLKKGKNAEITLSQELIACLLVHGFFCTFPRRNSIKKETDEYYKYPTINFTNLYKRSGKDGVADYIAEKLKTLIHYFSIVTKNSNYYYFNTIYHSSAKRICYIS